MLDQGWPRPEDNCLWPWRGTRAEVQSGEVSAAFPSEQSGGRVVRWGWGWHRKHPPSSFLPLSLPAHLPLV